MVDGCNIGMIRVRELELIMKKKQAQSAMDPIESDAIEGDVDISLITYNLGLSYEERILQHEAAFELVSHLIRAREGHGTKPHELT